MNIRRGLFRLWLLGAVIFSTSVFIVAGEDVVTEFRNNSLQKYLNEHKNYEVVIPVLCTKARGKIGIDYGLNDTSEPSSWNETTHINPGDACWYGMRKYRTLYPEDANLSDEAIARRQYVIVGRPLKSPSEPWVFLAWLLAFAIGIPLAVLVFGAALLWAFAGFATSKQPGSAQ